MNEIRQSDRSSKTLKFINDIIAYHKANPHEPIYVSSEDVRGMLLEYIPNANIKVAGGHDEKKS